MEGDVLLVAFDSGGSKARLHKTRLQCFHGGHVLLFLQHVGHHVIAHIPAAAHGDQRRQPGDKAPVIEGLDHLGKGVFRVVGPVFRGAHGGGIADVQAHDLRRAEDRQIEPRIGAREVGAHRVPGLEPRLGKVADAQGGKVGELTGALLLQPRGGGHDGGEVIAQKADAQDVLLRKGHPPPSLLLSDEGRRLLMEPGCRYHPVRIGEPPTAARQGDDPQEKGQDETDQ